MYNMVKNDNQKHDSEIESHFNDIHTALLQTFLNDSYCISILEGYIYI